MKIVAGLGNPGKKYEKTRHNTGFMVMDRLCEKLNVTLDKEKFKAIYGIYTSGEEKILLVKPLTFMNLSGEAIVPLMRYYDISIEDLIVVHDDLDLPVGKIRLRESGSSGGQKGMGNIIDLLGTRDIRRIRVGIDKNPDIPIIDYVLGKVEKEKWEDYLQAVDKAADALIYSFDHNFQKTMSNYNG